MWNRIDIEGKEYAIESGYEIIEVPPEELDRWLELGSVVVDDFVDSLVAAGYSEDEIRAGSAISRNASITGRKTDRTGIKASTGTEEMFYDFD